MESEGGNQEGRESSGVRAASAAVGHNDRRPFDKSELLDRTIAIWQPKANRKLTREDAREIVENMAGLFQILDEWDRAEKAKSQL